MTVFTCDWKKTEMQGIVFDWSIKTPHCKPECNFLLSLFCTHFYTRGERGKTWRGLWADSCQHAASAVIAVQWQPEDTSEKERLQVCCKWHWATKRVENECKWAKCDEKCLKAERKKDIWVSFSALGNELVEQFLFSFHGYIRIRTIKIWNRKI